MRIFQLHLSKYQRWVWFYIFLCICFSLWSYYNFEMIWHIMASSRCTMQHECIIALSSSSENESRNYFAPVDPRKSSWLLGRITRQEKKSHAKFRSEFQLKCYHPRWPAYLLNLTLFFGFLYRYVWRWWLLGRRPLPNETLMPSTNWKRPPWRPSKAVSLLFPSN